LIQFPANYRVIWRHLQITSVPPLVYNPAATTSSRASREPASQSVASVAASSSSSHSSTTPAVSSASQPLFSLSFSLAVLPLYSTLLLSLSILPCYSPSLFSLSILPLYSPAPLFPSVKCLYKCVYVLGGNTSECFLKRSPSLQKSTQNFSVKVL
jgi:hypothetical protein